MKEYKRWTDEFPTITLSLSRESAEEIEAEVWVGWIPFNELFLDGRLNVPAAVGFVLDLAFGNASTPISGTYVSKIANTILANASLDFDPRDFAIAGIMIRVDLTDPTVELVDVPLVIYCIGVSTDYPSLENLVLPSTFSNVNPWTVKDLSGGEVAAYWAKLE